MKNFYKFNLLINKTTQKKFNKLSILYQINTLNNKKIKLVTQFNLKLLIKLKNGDI